MKIIATFARWLLGLVFLVFGLNGFLHCIPMPPRLASGVNSWGRSLSPTIWSWCFCSS
jgi:hypothetical protein